MSNSGGGGFSGWDCPFCTYINKQSSFKCAMCGASRGTSTRQARLQPQMVDFFNIGGEGQATTKSSSAGPSSRNSTTHPPPRPSKSSSSPSTSRSPSPISVTSAQQPSSKQPGPPPKHKTKLQTATSSSSMGKGVGSKGKVRASRLRAHWPRVPHIDYHSGWTLEVRYAGENAAITEYQLLKS